jgi:electron transfer flavoprotein alpha subunit
MILVFSEDNEIAYEVLARGRQIADIRKMQLAAIIFGEGNKDLYIAAGADKIFTIAHEPEPALVVETIISLIDQDKLDIILIGGTKLGKEIAPMIAQRLSVGCATDCIDISLEQGQMIIKRLVLGGRFIGTQGFLRKPQIATVLPGKFEKKFDGSKKCEIINIPSRQIASKVQLLEIKKKSPETINIEDAPIIVSVGRGFRKKEDLKIANDLAEALGGTLGCSRSIAADHKWLPQEHWVGLSGHKVKPRLYIAIGISGQAQHIAGIKDSKTIIAINSDPNAPIFKACDYGIVGDLYEIVPKLTELLKKQELKG